MAQECFIVPSNMIKEIRRRMNNRIYNQELAVALNEVSVSRENEKTYKDWVKSLPKDDVPLSEEAMEMLKSKEYITWEEHLKECRFEE